MDIGDYVDELREEVKQQAAIIQYMRTVVKAYVDTYQSIGKKLKELDEDDEPDQAFEDDIELVYNQIQPLLTLWEDTRPENIDETLKGHSASAINKIGNTSLN